MGFLGIDWKEAGKSLYDPRGKYGALGVLSGGNVAGPPGTAGAPAAGDTLQRDPATGYLFDPNNGQYYDPNATDASGNFKPVVAPNVSQQVAGASALGRQYNGAVAGYDTREASDYGREASLADTLRTAAMGGGPNVAGSAFGVNADTLARQQMAMAAGSSGQGAVLSRIAAMNNTAQLGREQAAQAAMQRAQEMESARGQLAGLTGNMAGQSGAMSGAKTQAGLGEQNLAMTGEAGHEGEDMSAKTGNAQRQGAIVGGGANGLGGYITKAAMA